MDGAATDHVLCNLALTNYASHHLLHHLTQLSSDDLKIWQHPSDFFRWWSPVPDEWWRRIQRPNLLGNRDPDYVVHAKFASPLNAACWSGCLPWIRALLAASRAIIDRHGGLDCYGTGVPLKLARQHGHQVVVEELLRHGADVCTRRLAIERRAARAAKLAFDETAQQEEDHACVTADPERDSDYIPKTTDWSRICG